MSSNYSVLYRIKNKFSWPGSNRGFGMIELLVSISIMVIVSAIILTRQTSFNGAVLLRSEAYDVALRIREVQLSAVSAINRGGSDDFRSTLGIYFSTDANMDDSFPVFTFEIGSDGDGENTILHSVANTRFSEQGRIDERFEVREIIINGWQSVQNIGIVFQRPNFDAQFFNASGNKIPNAESVVIVVSRRGSTGEGPGDAKSIEITSTGQIGVIDYEAPVLTAYLWKTNNISSLDTGSIQIQ